MWGESVVKLHYIGDARINKKDTCIFRNEHGKFYVQVDGIITQKNLTASEIVRYLLNAKNK